MRFDKVINILRSARAKARKSRAAWAESSMSNSKFAFKLFPLNSFSFAEFFSGAGYFFGKQRRWFFTGFPEKFLIFFKRNKHHGFRYSDCVVHNNTSILNCNANIFFCQFYEMLMSIGKQAVSQFGFKATNCFPNPRGDSMKKISNLALLSAMFRCEGGC